MPTIREKVYKLLDYRGDISKNVSNGTGGSYSPDFSPNNIKRIVISTDGVLVQLHCGVDGYGKSIRSKVFDYVTFSSVELYREQCQPKYKPLLSLLSEHRIFANIEEVVLLANPVSVNIESNIGAENDVSHLIKGYTGAGSSIEERVKNRFVRLRYYTVLNMDFQTFLRGVVNTLRAGNCVLTERYLSEAKSLERFIANRIELNEESSALTSHGCQTGTYSFDAKVLMPYFAKVRSDYEASVKSTKVSEFKKEYDKKAVEEMNKTLEVYVKLLKVCNKYKKIMSGCVNTGVVTNEAVKLGVVFPQVYSYDGIKGVPSALVSSEKLDFKEAIAKNKEITEGIRNKVCSSISETFFKALDSYCNKENQFLCNLMLNSITETTIVVPAQCKTIASKLEKTFQVKFDGMKATSSIINSLWLLCYLFLDRDSEGYKSEYITREFWESEVQV